MAFDSVQININDVGGNMGKVKPQKPTQKQKEHISADKKNPKDFLVLAETDTELQLVRRSDGSRVTIKKKPKEREKRK